MILRIKFRKHDNKDSNDSVPVVPDPPVISSKRNVGMGYEEIQPTSKEITPPAIPPIINEKNPDPGVNPDFSLEKEINYFRDVYSQVFGRDLSVADREVIMMNLLFAIYSEITNLRAESNNEVKK